jgi:hypothetical protein
MRGHRYTAAYHFGIINGLMFIFAFAILFGEFGNTQMYFLFMPMAAMIVFDNKKTILSYFIVSMVLLAASFIIFNSYEPVYDVRNTG